MPKQLFTIGHSNHPLDRFLALLAQHQIKTLVDIRRFPSSRKHPHFNQENIVSALKEAGVEYRWLESLGGRRRKEADSSINLGLRNESFRNFADYMSTESFQEGVEQLLTVGKPHHRRSYHAEVVSELTFEVSPNAVWLNHLSALYGSDAIFRDLGWHWPSTDFN
jgi:uncharacterized protein (DUF488 family)